jgi:hypothetical protein
MTALLLLRTAYERFALYRLRGWNNAISLGSPPCSNIAVVRYFLDRSSDAPKRCTEIRKIYEGEQQTRDPEEVDMGKQRKQTQDRYDLKLELLRLVGYPLWQAMQPEVEISDTKNCGDQHETHSDHQYIRVARCGNEEREMVGCQGMNLIAQLQHSTKSGFPSYPARRV